MLPTTRDSLWKGRLVFEQPARGHGYRFNLDPVLLAGAAPAAETVVDLGCGCGVAGLLMLAWGKTRRAVGVEIQRELAHLARQNGEGQGAGERWHVVEADLRQPNSLQDLARYRPDLVVFNPPYFPVHATRPSPDPGRDAGRREVLGTLRDFVAAAAALAPRFAAVVRAQRGPELVELAATHGVGKVRVRAVHPRAGQPAGHWLVMAERGAVSLREEEPLVVHRGGGRELTPEVEAWVNGPPL